ncbi:MAG: hypothetical protein HN368_19240 [Spirochaetales bacterium]|jgi:hypothetical protein|nr:hypothetical protein [Spirochaetales bacterium]
MSLSEKPSAHDILLDAFHGKSIASPPFAPNLSLWYDWHSIKKTLPGKWEGAHIQDIYRDLGVPIWQTVRPWRRCWSVPVIEDNSATSRSVEYQVDGQVLTARWTLGPDGDWWQSEYPVKTDQDLGLLSSLFSGLSYELNADDDNSQLDLTGNDGVLAIELPMHPYPFILQHFLGWSEGLMIAMMNEEVVSSLRIGLEDQFRDIVSRLGELPGDLLYCPDNLDGSFLSPTIFESEMMESYRGTVDSAGITGKGVVVHAGGMVKNLAGPLAETGIDVIEGVCGPPQSDLSIQAGDDLLGGAVTMWGGIPQDALLTSCDTAEFESVVMNAKKHAASSSRCVIGIADRVPIAAEIHRLEWITDQFDLGT